MMFDGYEEQLTKCQEHNRRQTGNMSAAYGSVSNAQLVAIIVAQPYLILQPLPYPLHNAVMSVYQF